MNHLENESSAFESLPFRCRRFIPTQVRNSCTQMPSSDQILSSMLHRQQKYPSIGGVIETEYHICFEPLDTFSISIDPFTFPPAPTNVVSAECLRQWLVTLIMMVGVCVCVGGSGVGGVNVCVCACVCGGLRKGYCIWQAVEEVAWQHMQVGLTDFGGIKSRSSSSGISSSRQPSFSSWMLRSWLICCRVHPKSIRNSRKREQLNDH